MAISMSEVFTLDAPQSRRAVAFGNEGLLDTAYRANAHARRVGHKIAATSKELLVSAMTKIGEGGLWRSSLPPLPPGLQERPEGVVDVTLPVSPAERMECLRDLGRTMQGGSILVLGRRRLYPVRPEHPSVGEVSTASCNAALDALANAICQELIDQGYGLDQDGVATELLLRRGTLGVAADFDDAVDLDHVRRHKINEEALRRMAEECAVNLSVSPGMQLVVERGLPPVLHQPTFVICIGGGQVRVLTFAFVGEPVTGDRPDRKRTPFAIRLATDELGAMSRSRKDQKDQGDGASASKLRYASHAVDPAVQTSLDMIVTLEEELFQANEMGDWQKLAAVEPILEIGPEVEEEQIRNADGDHHHKADARNRMESDSWAVHTDLGEGYSGPLAHAPAKSAQHRGLPAAPTSRRFSWLLRRLGVKPEEADMPNSACDSVAGTTGL
mmetsp:Transcript_14888/g.27935  ORF Transcript_14888/g.27935 Transcript_14888/m.27935 type:complete len:443 (+) Transcript_14888:31-1359(+)